MFGHSFSLECWHSKVSYSNITFTKVMFDPSFSNADIQRTSGIQSEFLDGSSNKVPKLAETTILRETTKRKKKEKKEER